MPDFRELTGKGAVLAERLVSHAPRYGEQISLPVGFTFDTLLSEMKKPAGKRKIEFFEILCGRRIAGFCYYTIYERYRAAEIATIFLPAYRGRGLAAGTIPYMTAHAEKNYPELLRMEATASSSNPAAIAVLLSAGFKVEGVRPAGYVRGADISDAVLFGMLLGKKGGLVSSMYRIDSFKDKARERARLIKQGRILLEEEARLIRETGAWDRFSSARQIVDVGCGFGQFVDWLGRTFPKAGRIIGVDPSKWMLKMSEAQEDKRTRLRRSDGLKFLLGLPEGKTDIVCLRFVINHIPEKAWGDWLSAVNRCLRPGGMIYLTLADANYYKTWPAQPLMDLVFEHKKLLREKNGGVWNVPAVIGRHLHAAGFKRIIQRSACLTTEAMGNAGYASSVGDQFVWGTEAAWGSTGESARRSLAEASKRKDFWGQIKFGVHTGEKP